MGAAMKRQGLWIVVLLGGAGAAQAACDVESSAYHAEKTLGTADAYIGCLEPLVATPGFGVLAPGVASGINVTPTFGPVAPGNPNGMPVDEYLRQIKELGGYSDYDWTQVMASTMSADGSIAVVYDKDRVAPQYATEAPFVVTSTSPNVKQYFVDPAKFRDLSEYALEAAP